MIFKNIILTIFASFFIKTTGFSLNRRRTLGSIMGMNIVPPDNNKKTIPSQDILLENDESNNEFGIIQDVNNEIYFYGPVSQRSCFELKNKINELDLRSSVYTAQYKIPPPPIHLHIQSNGGSIFHTLYIVDLIQNIDTPVYTYIDGFAASAATLISVVGKKRFITKNSLMLIHQLSGSDNGKFYELQDQMTNMNILMNTIGNIYLNKTNIPPSELDVLLRKDLWLDSKTCLNYGLVDKII